MGFPQNVKEEALVLCARHCCLCHLPKGLKMEVHHIKQHSEGGTDTLDNAIPLCFECHADMRSYDHDHPKGLKYSRTELIRRRDDWYATVKHRGISPANQTVSNTDKAVLEHLLKLLPWNGSIQFIRNNNFAGFSFDLDRIRDFDYFVDECENPSFRFDDTALEQDRLQLLLHITDFNRAIGRYTFRVDNTASRSTVPPEWELSQPEQFDLAVNTIHNAATAACSAYDRLISGGKAKLGVISLGR